MSDFYPRNKWNEHLSDKEFEKRRRKAYLREMASIVSDGTREDTNKIAKELESEEFFAKAEKEAEERKAAKNRMKDLEDFLFNDSLDKIAARKMREHEERMEELEDGLDEEEADLIHPNPRRRRRHRVI